MKVYDDFNKVEEEIKENTHPTVYKFRTWEDAYHQRIIINREAWFAHPHSLNDPYDVRPPYNFIVENIDWNAARIKIREAGRYFEPSLSEAELEKEVDVRLKIIRDNPVEYFQNNRSEHVLEKSNYDSLGVFSCCCSFGNESMWAHYGNNHCGFAVGFNTVELTRALKCTVGYVNYNDTPVNYNILGNNEGILNVEIFQKSTRWKSEEELRFITSGIGFYRERASIFPVNAVSEIVFGINTSKEIQDEIIKQSNKHLPGIPFYKAALQANSYGFQKIKIN